jgi:hypothetical protein
MIQLMFQYQHVIEVNLHIFVDQVNLINKKKLIIRKRKFSEIYFGHLFDRYYKFLLYGDNEMLIYASNQLHHEQYY